MPICRQTAAAAPTEGDGSVYGDAYVDSGFWTEPVNSIVDILVISILQFEKE